MLLVDDHALVRAGFYRIIVEAFPDVDLREATTAAEAVDSVRNSPPEVVVLDISLPGRSGLDALAEIRAIAPRLPVLMMTLHGEDQFAVRSFRTGAAGYITKDCSAEELVEAVKKVLSGGRYVSRAMAESLAAGLTENSTEAVHETLSQREFQVLRMLATGMTVKAIGYALHISDKTVSTYRARVLEKMHLQSTAEIMRYAHRTKLVD